MAVGSTLSLNRVPGRVLFAGPHVVRWFIDRRFAGLENRELLSEYAYQLSAARGSGEYALTSLLYPGGYARSPLKKRLYGLQVSTTFVVRCDR